MRQADSIEPEHVGQPGTNGIWTFVFIDMIVFGLIFLVFLSEKFRIHELFIDGQANLDFRFGLANTIVLITSSLFMVKAVSAARDRAFRQMKRFLVYCLICGVIFCLNKIFEYRWELAAGFTPAYNSFFSFYYFITGAHFLHVLGGLVAIVHCLRQPLVQVESDGYLRKLENTGLFWHFVDLLWIFIFPLLYLDQGII